MSIFDKHKEGYSTVQVTYRPDLLTPIVNTDFDERRDRILKQNNVPQYKSPANSRDALGQIYNLYKMNQKKGEEAMYLYKQLQQRSDSNFYNPYTTATNKAVAELAQYGIDTSVIDDDFFERNKYLTQYLNYNGQTNTPSAPGKKASDAEKAAYAYYQIWNSEEATKKAEEQWGDLQKEISYWANRKDRNYSDEEVLAKIDWSKYGELTKMDANKYMKPNEYNRAIGYSKDALYGVLWAARNGGGSGDIERDIACSALGVGNSWKPNESIAARLDEGNIATYSPYSVGSTMEQEGLYFGVDSFDWNWIINNRSKVMNSGDDKAKEYYANVVKAYEYTSMLKDQLKDLHSEIDYLVGEGYDADEIINRLRDKDFYGSQFNDLFDLDDTFITAKLKSTTEAVDYRWEDVKEEIRQKCADHKTVSGELSVLVNDSDYWTKKKNTVFDNEEEDQGVKEEQGATKGQSETKTPSTTKTPSATKTQSVNERAAHAGMFSGTDLAPVETPTTAQPVTTEPSVTDTQTTPVTNDVVQPVTDLAAEEEHDKVEARYINAVYDAIVKFGTDIEKTVFQTAKNTLFSKKAEAVSSVVTPAEESAARVADDLYKVTAQNYLGTLKIIDDYTKEESELAAVNKRIEVLKGKITELSDKVKASPLSFEDSLTEEEARYLALYGNELQSLTDEVRERTAHLKKQAPLYNSAVAEQKKLYNRYDSTGEMVRSVGGKFNSDLPSDMEHLYAAAKEWTPSQWTAYSMWTEAEQEGMLTRDDIVSDAMAYVAQGSDELRILERALKEADRYGINLTDTERKRVEQKVAVLKREIKQAGDYLLAGQADFEEVATKAMERGATDGMSDLTKANVKAIKDGSYDVGLLEMAFGDWFDSNDPFKKQFLSHASYNIEDYRINVGRISDMLKLMTPEEKLGYFYRLETEGEDAANEYFQRLVDPQYGVLQTRQSQDMSARLQEFSAQGGWKTVLGYGASFVTNYLGNMQAWLTGKINDLEGVEGNPYGPGYMGVEGTTALRAGTLDRLKKDFGEEHADAIDFWFNSITSAGDSALNAVMTSAGLDFVADVVPFVGKFVNLLDQASAGSGILKFGANAANDFIHALPMAMGAAEQAARQAKIDGASPDQIKQIYKTTLLAESITEAITYGNISGMFKMGSAEGVPTALKDFLKQLVSNGLEEALGEGINQYWEDTAERSIMGAMNQYNQLYNYYYNELGLPAKVADEMVSKELTKNVLRAAASGFISSGVSGTVSFGVGKYESAVQKWQYNKAMRSISLNDANKIAATRESSNTTKAVVTSGILRSGVEGVEADAAAQQIVAIGGGDAVEAIGQTIYAAEERNTEVKQAISYATLTSGKASAALDQINQKHKAGEPITRADVDNLLSAAKDDQSGPNAEYFEKERKDAVIKNRMASRLRDKIANKETADKFEQGKKKIKEKKEDSEEAKKKTKEAQDNYDAVSQNADDALDEALTNPGIDDNNGDVEQLLNEKEGADRDVAKAEEAEAAAAEEVEKARSEVEKEQQGIVDEIRIESQNEVAQEVANEEAAAAEQAQQEHDAAIQKYNPAIPFKSPVTVPLKGGGTAKIIGGAAVGKTAKSDGRGAFIWATTDGYVSDVDIDWANWDYNGKSAIDKVINEMDESKNPGAPAIWLDHSYKATTEDGNEVNIVGIAGSLNGDVAVMDSAGNTYEAVELAYEDEKALDELTDLFDSMEVPILDAAEQYRAQNPDVDLPETFYPYPGGSAALLTQWGEQFNIIGISTNDNGDVEYIAEDGTPIPYSAPAVMPQDFHEWVASVTGTEEEEQKNFNYGEWVTDYGTKPNAIFPTDQNLKATVKLFEKDGTFELTGMYVTATGNVLFTSNHGSVVGDQIDTIDPTRDGKFFAWALDVANKELSNPEQGKAATRDGIEHFIESIDDLLPIEGLVDTSNEEAMDAGNEQESAPEEEGFKYTTKQVPSLGSTAMVAPVLGNLDNGKQVDGITFDVAGDLVYTYAGAANAYTDAHSHDVTNKSFIQWAQEALTHMHEVQEVDNASIESAKYWLNEQLNDATSDDVITNNDFGQSGENVADQLYEISFEKENPDTHEALYVWQDPKFHGKVKSLSKFAEKYLTAEKVPGSQKFKKFFAHNAPEALPYLTRADGSPRLFYRGYGSAHGSGMGHHLHVSSGTPVYKLNNGKKELDYEYTFFSDVYEVAATYAGDPKITKLRYINNWETAKAAMQDLGLDLQIAYDPTGSGQPGYQVMYKNSFGELVPSNGRWFAENQLTKFRQTYGGNPTHSGMLAGYIATEHPVIIDAKGSNYSTIHATVTAPDGETITAVKGTDQWVEWAFHHGADAVIIDDVLDMIYGGHVSGCDVIIKDSGMFKSVFNNGDWTFGNREYLALKISNAAKAAKQNAQSVLESLMGQPISAQFNKVKQRYLNGENVPIKEVMDLPEVKFGLENRTEGSTIDSDLFDEARKPEIGDWFSYIMDSVDRATADRIMAARDIVSKYGSAVIDKNGKTSYTGDIAKGKRLDLLIGLPASGKSTIADHISAMYKSRVCDADFAKAANQLYAGGLNEDYVHVESKVVNDSIMEDAIANGENVLFSAIGSDLDSLLTRLEPFEKAGYSVHVHMTDLDQNKALGRMLGRYAKEGRFLDFESVAKIDPNAIADTFESLKGRYQGYAKWNTDVEQGTNPVPTEASTPAETNIFGRNSVLESKVVQGNNGNADSAGEGSDNGGSNRGLTNPTIEHARKVKAKLKSPQQIVKTLVKSLGFGDYVGSNNFGRMPKAVRAYWDQHAELIAVRDKDIGNLTVGAHEVGHGIAKRFGLHGSDQMVQNLISAEPAFAEAYSSSELRDEAFAEFIVRYLASEEDARAFAGDDYYDMFERTVSRDVGTKKALDEAKKNIRIWKNADANTRLDAIVRYENTPEKMPLREYLQDFITRNVDSTAVADPIDQMVEDLTGKRGTLRLQGLFANHSQKRAKTILNDSLTDANGTIIGDGLAKAISDTGFKTTQDNVHALEKYMLLKHSFDRDIEMKPVFGEDLTEADRYALVKQLEDTIPNIAAAADAFQTFRHNFLQAWMVDTGYWSQEFLDSLEKKYPNYVPTFRVRGNMTSSEATGWGKSSKKYTLHEATGGSEDILSPMYSFVGMVDQITSMVATNQIAQTFDKYYNEYEGFGEFARLIPGSTKDTAVEANPEGTMTARQKQLFNLLKDEISDDLMEEVMNITKGRPGVNQSATNGSVLTVQREDGTTVEYEIYNPQLYKFLSGVQGSTGIRAAQTIGRLTRTMSMLTTGSNPLFALRNAVRDYQNSVNYGSWASNYLSGAPKWISALFDVIRKSDVYKEYEALGGGGWTRIERNNTKSMKELTSDMFGDDRSSVGKTAKWLGKKLWNTVTAEGLNEAIEQASRLVEYKYGKHDTSTAMGRMEAFQAAQDVTVDFSRSGNSETAYLLKKVVPFFGASLQGVYRTGRQFTKAERGRVGARITKNIVNTALASALSVALNFRCGDDDDKEEFMMLSDGIKAGHLILPNPLKGLPGQPPYLRIPLAQDPLTYAVHSLVTNAMVNGSDDEMAISLAATADVILDNLNPLGSGTIFQPLVDVSHNRTWYGTPIVNYNMQDWEDETVKYEEDTPEIFKTGSRALKWLTFGLVNANPEVLEYLASQYTGFLGQMAIPALSINDDGSLGGLDALLTSVRKKWTADPLSSNNYTKAFYEMKSILSSIVDVGDQRPQNLLLPSLTQEQVNAAYDEAKAMTSKGGIVYETNKLIKDTTKAIEKINGNDTLSDEEKYTQTRALKLKMLHQVEATNGMLQAYHKKYIQGETLTDRVFKYFQHAVQEGKTVHIKTDIENMSDAFRKDAEKILNNDFDHEGGELKYMNRVMSVYNGLEGPDLGGGKAAALPHPSYTFTLNTVNGEQEYTITEEERAKYDNEYKRYYEAYVNGEFSNLKWSKAARDWDRLEEKDQYEVLKAAASYANGKMKTLYAKDKGIKVKK